MGYTSILVTLDGSKLSELALQQVIRIANSDARIHLLSIVAEDRVTEVARLATAMTDTNEKLNEQWPHAAGHRNPYDENAREKYLDEMREWLEPAGYHVTTEVRQGNVIETILQVAKQDFEIIVMVTHGHTGIKRTVVGSVTNAVLEQASCPMLIIPARATATI